MKMPLMFEMSQKKVLVVGGGKVGLRKADKLVDFGAQVTVVSRSFDAAVADLSRFACIDAAFDQEHLNGIDIVVAATDSIQTNDRIYEMCHSRGILCQTVDPLSPSDFDFMATAMKEQLLIGVSTQGGSPGFSKKLVKHLMDTVSDEQLATLNTMIEQRMKTIKRHREM